MRCLCPNDKMFINKDYKKIKSIMEGLKRHRLVSMILIFDWAYLPYRAVARNLSSQRLHISLARSRAYISLIRTNLNATVNTCTHVRIACSIACYFRNLSRGTYLRILDVLRLRGISFSPLFSRTHSHTRTRENAHRHTSHARKRPSLTAKYIYNNILRPKNKLYYVLPAN